MKQFFTIVVFVLLYHIGYSQTWKQLSSIGAANNRNRAGSFAIDGKGYIIAGGGSGYLTTAFAYDTLSDSWSQIQDFPSINDDACVGFAINGFGYMGTGGYSGYNFSNSFYKYDPGMNQWTQMASIPGPVRSFAVSFTVGGKGYLGGGANGFNNNILKDFYEFDPTNGPTGSWTQMTDCPAAGISLRAVGFAIGNKGYVGTGGMQIGVGSTNFVPQKDFWEFDPSNGPGGTWTQKADYGGTPRMLAVGFANCNLGYIGLGSIDATQSTFGSDFWQYDPVNDQWTLAAGTFGGVPRESSSAFVIGNTAYVGLGYPDNTANPPYYGDLWKYVPSIGFTAPTSACVGQPVAFTDQSNFGPTSWTWTFTGGTPATSNGQNPSVTYSTAGSYDVSLTAFNSCYNLSTTAVQYITVSSPAGTLVIDPPSPKICPGGSVTLSVPGGGSNLTWSPPTGLNQTTGNSVLANPTTTTVYTVSSSGGCGAFPGTDTVIVNTVVPLTVLPANPGVCAGETITLTASGGTGISWIPPTGLNTTSGNVVIANAPADSIVYTLAGTDSLGCDVSGRVTVHTGGRSVPGTVHALRDTLCQGTPGNLTLVGNSTNAIQWRSSTDSINFTDITSAIDTTKYRTQPLLKSAWYYAEVGSGICIANSDTLELVVPPALSAFFGAAQTAPNQLTFNSDSSEGNIRSYHWDFGDGKTSTESNPVHSYKNDSTYYVCLTLYDGSNCSYTFCRYLTPSALAVPAVLAAGDWLIYPNPFGNQLIISSKQTNNHIQSIEMYDVLGRLMINENVNHTTTNTSLQLDVSVLAKGMYFLKLKTADAGYVQKVVKQ